MNNFNWQPIGTYDDSGFFANVKPKHVLYYFDGPRIYTFESNNLMFFAYLCDEELGAFRHIVVPVDDQIVYSLKAGYLSVRDVLEQPWAWIVDLDGHGALKDAWRISIRNLPAEVLPETGTMLFPALEPIFRLKLDGANLSANGVPASVVKRGVDGAYAALMRVSQELFDAVQPGRPARALKHLFDLPTQRMAFGSFEISFGPPVSMQQTLPSMDVVEEQLTSIGSSLDQAIGWACGVVHTVPPLNLLEAVSRLAPPRHGLIEKVYVSGRIFPSREYILDRQASLKIRTELTNAKSESEEVVTINGLPTEFDKERMSFRLKLDSDSEDYICRFQDEHYDELIDIFSSDDISVRVILKIKKGSRMGDVLELSRNQK